MNGSAFSQDCFRDSIWSEKSFESNLTLSRSLLLLTQQDAAMAPKMDNKTSKKVLSISGSQIESRFAWDGWVGGTEWTKISEEWRVYFSSYLLQVTLALSCHSQWKMWGWIRELGELETTQYFDVWLETVMHVLLQLKWKWREGIDIWMKFGGSNAILVKL